MFHSKDTCITLWAELVYGLCACVGTCLHVCTYSGLNPPFLKGPWTANNKCRSMTVVRKAQNVSKNESTKHDIPDNCLVFNLMFYIKYTQIKFQYVLFITPANAAHVREWFNNSGRSIAFGTTNPHCSCSLQNHSLLYLYWKQHMCAAQRLQIYKNRGPHPS